MSYQNSYLPKKMTFTALSRCDEIFSSDKKLPKINKMHGVIKPRDGRLETLEATVYDKTGTKFTGVLKNDKHNKWWGFITNNSKNTPHQAMKSIHLNYNPTEQCGYLSISSGTRRKNPYTQKMHSFYDSACSPLHISGTSQKYSSLRDIKNISFQQKASYDRPAIKGTITNTQNNAIRKIQFQTNGETFKGEMNAPMQDIDAITCMAPVSKGYAIGDKGHLATIYHIQEGKKNTIYTNVTYDEYEYPLPEYKKNEIKTAKCQQHYLKNKDIRIS